MLLLLGLIGDEVIEALSPLSPGNPSSAARAPITAALLTISTRSIPPIVILSISHRFHATTAHPVPVLVESLTTQPMDPNFKLWPIYIEQIHHTFAQAKTCGID